MHIFRELGVGQELFKCIAPFNRREEGFVSDYAKREPIENAAEVTMFYLYHRKRLMIRAPRQFAFVHHAYRDMFRGKDGKDGS